MYSNSSDPANVDLEKEYSPTLWSKRFPVPADCVRNHMEVAIKDSIKMREKYPKTKFNVPYGHSAMETYDIFFKDQEVGTPIFVYVHGGYWQRLSKDLSSYCVGPLVEKGYRVIVVEYDLCPKVSLENIVVEIKQCIKHILEYAKETGATEVSLSGHSAGAHLIACILETDFELKDLIKHFFLISGPFDLREIWNTNSCRSISNVNNPLQLDDENAIRFSPMLFKNIVKGYKSKFHLYVGKYEAPSFFGQSKAFSEVLLANKFEVYLHEFPENDHFDIAHDMKDEDSEITKHIFKALGL